METPLPPRPCRYGINNFTTSSGLRGFVGVICQPSTFTSLEIGYVYEDGKALPVEEVDLPLWRHGEEGRHQPTDFAFRYNSGINVRLLKEVHQEGGENDAFPAVSVYYYLSYAKSRAQPGFEPGT